MHIVTTRLQNVIQLFDTTEYMIRTIESMKPMKSCPSWQADSSRNIPLLWNPKIPATCLCPETEKSGPHPFILFP